MREAPTVRSLVTEKDLADEFVAAFASRLLPEPHAWEHEGSALRLAIDLPPHAVAALTVEGAMPV